MTEQIVGCVGVDAGLIMIGDPCYHLHTSRPKPEFGADWQEFCSYLDLDKAAHNIGDGLAMVISNFGGDGVYDVFIRRDENGRIIEAGVKFD